MLCNLAARNVKRQIGNYLIYFITVTLTVALMFAVNSVIFEKGMLVKASQFAQLRAGLIGVTVIASLIVAFVLGYATSFMLKLRKREFGTYLTLGMTRKNILLIFLLETLILCLLSLATGLLLGLGVYQGVMAIATSVMDIKYTFAAYSVQGFVLTVGLVVGMFLLSSATSALYLHRVSIINLLHGAQKSERRVRLPALWFAVTVISLAVLIFCCIMFRSKLMDALKTNGEATSVFYYFAAAAVAVILFHIGFCKSVFYILLKSEKIKNKGTNAFVMRGLSSKLSTNSVMTGMLAFLITFAVIGANFSFTMQAFNDETLNRDYPFDISAEIDLDEENAVTPEQADIIIAKHTQIVNRTYYALYTSGTQYLHGFTKWSGENYSLLTDVFITESDFNKVYCPQGYAPVDLKGGFCIAVNSAVFGYQVQAFDFSAATLNFGGKELKFTGFTEAPVSCTSYFIAVIPDGAEAELTKKSHGIIYDLKDNNFDAQALRDELTYKMNSGNWQIIMCDFDIREYARAELNALSAIFIIGALYISFVFVFMAMAILALKTLADLAENRRKFEILYRIGASPKERRSALFKQIFTFFILPFAVPLLLSIPTVSACAALMSLSFVSAVGKTIATGVIIAIVIAAVYTLYFTATYLLAKRCILNQ